MLKRKVDMLDFDFDNIFFLSRRDKLAQAYSLAKGTLSDQWSADSKAIENIDCRQVSKTLVIKALLDIVTSEEYYEQNLKMYCDREFIYEDFQEIENTRTYQTVFHDCELGDKFYRETSLRKQTNTRDQATINDLRRYLGLEHC
jgi:LPS sulfotransferase NodH